MVSGKYIVVCALMGVLLIFGLFFVSAKNNVVDKLREDRISEGKKETILDSLRGSDKIEKKVLRGLRNKDYVRVAILLGNSNLKGVDKLSRRKKKIKENQNEVLEILSRRDFHLIHQYNTINALAGEVNIRALRILEKLPVVKEVQIDKIRHLTLSESIPLIEVDYVHSALGYTGKGITVCMLDSGVDYTHPSIGGVDCTLFQNIENLTPSVESPHNYPDNYDNTWTITKPGYENIAVHFEQISLEKEYDHIEILDGNNDIFQIIKFPSAPGPSCENKFNIWSESVPGDTIKIRLLSDESVNCWGFNATKVMNTSWSGCGDFLGGYDYVNKDGDPMDDNGHGTHIAGIITSNNETYRGVAPNATIVAAKVCGADDSCSSLDLAAGVDWCTANKDAYGISVMSISIGGGNKYSSACDNLIDTIAINNAADNGIFVAVSSGNNNWIDGISAPACASNAISVGATKKDDTMAGYTNRDELLDLLAPGGIWNYDPDNPCITGCSEIVSTFSQYVRTNSSLCFNEWGTPPTCHDNTTNVTDYFIRAVGTSMACPHVSGLAALMLEANNTLNWSQIRDIMNDTGIPIYDSGSGLTFSRINASAALDAVAPAEFVSITVSSNTLSFGSIEEGGAGTPAENPLNITIDSNTNYEVTTKADATNFSGPDPFDAGYLQYSNSSSLGPWTGYTTSEVNIFSGSSPGANHSLYHKLEIPSGTDPGDYTLDLTFKVLGV
jgi:subtilisin family serine protease